MEVQILEKLVNEADDCLKTARKDAKHPEDIVNVNTAKSMFTNYYGKLIISALKEVVEEQKQDHGLPLTKEVYGR